MRLAVTGATGFLGCAFVAEAWRAGHRIRALVREDRRVPAVLVAPRIELVWGDLEQPLAMARLLEGADALVHLAALGVQARDRDWARAARVNALVPLDWVGQAARTGVRQLVAVGTCLEYAGHGRLPATRWQRTLPTPRLVESSPLGGADAYGATKAAGGLLLCARARAEGLSHWYLRLASLYGPGDAPEKILPAALRAARERRPFEMSAGEQVREWLHVSDAVRALLAAVERPGTGAVNVGTGRGLTLRRVVTGLFEAAGADPSLLRLGARAYLPGEPQRVVMDVSRARLLLGFEPAISLEDGLRELARGSAPPSPPADRPCDTSL